MAYNIFRIVGEEKKPYGCPVSEMWKAEAMLKCLGGFADQFIIDEDERDPTEPNTIFLAYKSRYKLTVEEVAITVEKIAALPPRHEGFGLGGRVAEATTREQVIKICKEDPSELEFVAKPWFHIAHLRNDFTIQGVNRAYTDTRDLYIDLCGRDFLITHIYRNPIKVANIFTEYLM